MENKIEVLKEFEQMKEQAEVKALSKLSLEQPLSDEQLKRLKELTIKSSGG